MKISVFARPAVLLLAASLILPMGSCGDAVPAGPDESTPAVTGDTTPPADVTTGQAYDFTGIDFGGGELNILNSTNTWGAYDTIDLESTTGEQLDDAVFNRNRDAEEKFHFTLKVTDQPIADANETARRTIMADEDVYQTVYLRGDNIAAHLTDGLYLDLQSVDGFQLDREWWNQATTAEGRIGKDGSLLFASNYLSLVGFDLTICTFFNETMLENLQADKPYDLVREGKWTIDKLKEYTKLGANLNGDDSFDWEDNGNAVYGMTTWYNGLSAMIFGTGERYVRIDEEGMPYIASGGERFLDVCAKIASLTATKGEFLQRDANSGEPSHYEEIFRNGRSLFVVAELKASSKYRSLEDTFGIVPLPKYDEAQESYYGYTSPAQYLMMMPVTCQKQEQTAKVIDALAYLSWRDILPIYYDYTVSQKGLRNEDSIEMLEIISENRCFDPGDAYGWASNLKSAVQGQLTAGSADVASFLASLTTAAELSIQQTLEKLEG